MGPHVHTSRAPLACCRAATLLAAHWRKCKGGRKRGPPHPRHIARTGPDLSTSFLPPLPYVVFTACTHVVFTACTHVAGLQSLCVAASHTPRLTRARPCCRAPTAALGPRCLTAGCWHCCGRPRAQSTPARKGEHEERHGGSQACISSGMQAREHAQALACKHACMHKQWHASTQARTSSSSMQARTSSMQALKHAQAVACKHTSTYQCVPQLRQASERIASRKHPQGLHVRF